MSKRDGKKKAWLNIITGEVVYFRYKFSAVHYFKADGKRVGYKVSRADIIMM